MARYLKFTVGGFFGGYKTVEIFISGEVSYKILRNGLLEVDRNKKIAAQMSDDWLAELEELEIFSWAEDYFADILDGTQWELIFKDGEQIYRGHGSNSYPENWEQFLDWLDALIPEMEFVNRRRLEKITLNYSRWSEALGREISERLTLDRREKILTLDKKFSKHIYKLDDGIKKIFDAAQIFFDDLEIQNVDSQDLPKINIELVHHDGSTEIFETLYSESFLPDIKIFIETVQSFANDVLAEIFSPGVAKIDTRRDKYIFCKVQFKGTYKAYSYRTEDETLAVGDVVDVPVGKNNDVAQAKIVEIGYFDEYEAPFPVDKIKMIIGKHVDTGWDNY